MFILRGGNSVISTFNNSRDAISMLQGMGLSVRHAKNAVETAQKKLSAEFVCDGKMYRLEKR